MAFSKANSAQNMVGRLVGQPKKLSTLASRLDILNMKAPGFTLYAGSHRTEYSSSFCDLRFCLNPPGWVGNDQHGCSCSSIPSWIPLQYQHQAMTSWHALSCAQQCSELCHIHGSACTSALTLHNEVSTRSSGTSDCYSSYLLWAVPKVALAVLQTHTWRIDCLRSRAEIFVKYQAAHQQNAILPGKMQEPAILLQPPFDSNRSMFIWSTAAPWTS